LVNLDDSEPKVCIGAFKNQLTKLRQSFIISYI
jgi:hypothetical protein